MTEFKGVTRSDTEGNWDFYLENKRGTTGMKCKLDLHALDHYSETDKMLSNEFIDKFVLLLENNGIKNCQIKVIDGYNEEGDNQHYRLGVRFGNDDKIPLLKETQLFVGYSATAHLETFNGSIKVVVSLPSNVTEDVCEALTRKAFSNYDELVVKNYPDWKTEYKSEPNINIAKG